MLCGNYSFPAGNDTVGIVLDLEKNRWVQDSEPFDAGQQLITGGIFEECETICLVLKINSRDGDRMKAAGGVHWSGV